MIPDDCPLYAACEKGSVDLLHTLLAQQNAYPAAVLALALSKQSEDLMQCFENCEKVTWLQLFLATTRRLQEAKEKKQIDVFVEKKCLEYAMAVLRCLEKGRDKNRPVEHFYLCSFDTGLDQIPHLKPGVCILATVNLLKCMLPPTMCCYFVEKKIVGVNDFLSSSALPELRAALALYCKTRFAQEAKCVKECFTGIHIEMAVPETETVPFKATPLSVDSRSALQPTDEPLCTTTTSATSTKMAQNDNSKTVTHTAAAVKSLSVAAATIECFDWKNALYTTLVYYRKQPSYYPEQAACYLQLYALLIAGKYLLPLVIDDEFECIAFHYAFGDIRHALETNNLGSITPHNVRFFAAYIADAKERLKTKEATVAQQTTTKSSAAPSVGALARESLPSSVGALAREGPPSSVGASAGNCPPSFFGAQSPKFQGPNGNQAAVVTGIFGCQCDYLGSTAPVHTSRADCENYFRTFASKGAYGKEGDQGPTSNLPLPVGMRGPQGIKGMQGTPEPLGPRGVQGYNYSNDAAQQTWRFIPTPEMSLAK
jgi:hypothetical protein